jgi:uncharacterized protein YndB with AHSA1/START domain
VAREAESSTADREIVTTRLYDAPRPLVWQAFTSAEHLAHWWGPDGFTISTHHMDFRIGGTWQFMMHGPDGTDYPNVIRYLEITEPSRIAFAHGAEPDGPPYFHNTITFEAEGPRTRVTMRAIFPTADARDIVVRDHNAIEGGKQTLGRLDGYLKQVTVMSVARHFAFAPDRVYDAWLTADSARHWWFRTPTGTSVSCAIDPTPGGSFRIVEQRGDAQAEHFGIFVELERPKRIAFDFATDREQKPTRVTIHIDPTPEGCVLTLWHIMDPQWAAFSDRTRTGWTMILDGLATTLA